MTSRHPGRPFPLEARYFFRVGNFRVGNASAPLWTVKVMSTIGCGGGAGGRVCDAGGAGGGVVCEGDELLMAKPR